MSEEAFIKIGMDIITQSLASAVAGCGNRYHEDTKTQDNTYIKKLHQLKHFTRSKTEEILPKHIFSG